MLYFQGDRPEQEIYEVLKRYTRQGDNLPVHILNEQSDITVHSNALGKFLERVIVRELGRDDVHVNVLLADDARISELNRRFLGRDGPTDVLAFPVNEETSVDDEPVFGEVVVSAETALREAPGHNSTPRRELTLYAVHGLLHLVGYDDQTEDGRQKMETRQQEIMEDYPG